MAAGKSSKPSRAGRPATTAEARENELIILAERLAERQLAEGTASAQVISHYLKLASSRERLEQQKIREENELLRAKRESLEASRGMEDLYANAIAAMKRYSGQEPSRSDDYED